MYQDSSKLSGGGGTPLFVLLDGIPRGSVVVKEFKNKWNKWLTTNLILWMIYYLCTFLSMLPLNWVSAYLWPSKKWMNFYTRFQRNARGHGNFDCDPR
jgi:hypothetical protein